MMELEEFKFIERRLNEPKDAFFMHEMMGHREDMLFNILAKKIVQKVMRDYYKIKSKSKKLLSMWKKGKTFVELADGVDFSPVLTAFFVLSEKGWSKKEFQRLLKDPNKIENARINKEIKEVCEKDFVYSPKSVEMQAAHGTQGEDKLEKWLDKRKIKYMTENDIKMEAEDQTSVKTPDILIRTGIKINKKKYFWIESKSSFGSPDEMRRNYKKQLKAYTELFGKGIVIYWYGFVEDYPLDDKIDIWDESFLKKAKVTK